MRRRRYYTTRGNSRRLPQTLLSLLFWVLWMLLIFKVDPLTVRDLVIPGSYLPFLGLGFISVLSLLWVVRQRARMAFIWASALVLILVLRLVGMGHWVNVLLIIGLVAAAEVYFYQSKRSNEPMVEDETASSN